MREARIAFKLTYRCQGRCLYCGSRKNLWKKRGGTDIAFSLIHKYKQMLTHRNSHPFREIHFTGGEPSLHPHFINIVASLYEVGIPLTATTAGWGQKKGRWKDVLTDITFRKLYISLDHSDIKINDHIRGTGSWQRAIQAIEDAVDSRNKTGSPEVTVVSVITHHTVLQLLPLISMLLSLGVDRWLPAYLEGGMYCSALFPSTLDYKQLREQRLHHPLLDKALGTAFHLDWHPKQLASDGKRHEDTLRLQCTTRGRLAIVHPKGAVYPCYGSEYNELEKLKVTNDIVNTNFIHLLSDAAKKFPTACQSCPEPMQQSQLLSID